MSKTLNKTPSRARVMLDANIVVYALFPQVGKHQSCKKLLQRGARGDVQLYMVVNTVADVIHRAMVLELLSEGTFQTSGKAVSYLKQNPHAIQKLTRYKTILSDLKQARINILPLTYRDLHASKSYRQKYGVMTNDSLILAVMQRERIHYLATNDTDFQRVPGIAVRVPARK